MNEKETTKPRPLFASAEAISQSATASSATDEHSNSGNSSTLSKANDLESLNLDLASSTLDAILAAQQIPTSVQKIPTSGSQVSPHDREDSLSENDKKNVQHLSEDGSDEFHHSSSKKRKRSRETHKHKKKKKHKHKKHRSHSPSPERSALLSAATEVQKGKHSLEDIAKVKADDHFHIDRKANKDLRTYESVSKLHIAKYRLACQSCVGNPTVYANYPIQDRDQKTKKKKWNDSRYFGKENIKLLRKRGSSFYSDLDSCKITHQPEFINLPEVVEERKNDSPIGSYSCLDESTSLYVQGKGKLSSATDGSDDYVMDEIFEKIARFNQKTREDPNNVDLWLEFVKFQDVVAMEDKSFKKQTLHLYDVYRPSKSVIEKKLAILEKAVELNQSSLKLKESQLELYQDIWESDKIERAWEDLLFVHSSNIDLWRHYLSRQQSHLRTFSFTKVLKKYQKCFQALIPILEGQVEVIKKSENLEEKLLGLFHQYCSFLQQSGYTERAVASFQAMVEINLFCPSELNLSSTKNRLTKFESFWESSAPKFGDQNAKGWAEWEKNKEERNNGVGFLPVSTEEMEDSILAASLPKSQTWSQMEKARCSVYWLPWKPNEGEGETEDNCEDPDRLILFGDISPALFRLKESHSCVRLVCLFLSFLGLNNRKIENVISGIDVSRFDGYLLTELHQFQSSLLMNLNIKLRSVWMPHKSLVNIVKNVILQAESYFSLNNRLLFTLLRIDIDLQKNGVSNVQALQASSCREMKKLGKNLLKESQNRNNLVIWDAYIRLLWVLSDKMEETVSMVDTALKMFTGSNYLSDPNKAKGICLLCRTFAEIMLNFEPFEYVVIKGRHTAPKEDDKNQVIGCMGALFEGSKFKTHSKVDSSPPSILRIRKRAMKLLETYISNLDDSLTSTCHTIVAFTECYVLFEYCTSGFNISNQIFINMQAHIKDIKCDNPSTAVEIKNVLKDLYISQISFISNVMHIESIPLSCIRETLGQALSDFPKCSYFHKTFLEVEYGSFLVGRVRKFYDKHLRCSPSVTHVVFAVFAELSHLAKLSQGEESQTVASDSGFVHRIRSLFQHSLEIPVCTQCPLLWRMWLAFEIKHGTKTRAKGILYQALQSCPWAKLLYIDGVEYFGDEELQEMADLMTEKEIRVCMPLEEVDLLINAEKESAGEEETADVQDD